MSGDERGSAFATLTDVRPGDNDFAQVAVGSDLEQLAFVAIAGYSQRNDDSFFVHTLQTTTVDPVG